MLTAYLHHKGKPLETPVSRAQMFQAIQKKESLLWVDLEDANEFETDSLVEIFNFHPLGDADLDEV